MSNKAGNSTAATSDARRLPVSASPADQETGLSVADWNAHLRAQRRNVARALELLEQAASIVSDANTEEPDESSIAIAAKIRGAVQMTFTAGTELLIAAGGFESAQVVADGTFPQVWRS